MYAIRSYYASETKRRCMRDISSIRLIWSWSDPAISLNDRASVGDATGRGLGDLACGGGRQDGVYSWRNGAGAMSVITSYSIHYTKLYDAIRRSDLAAVACRAPRDLLCGRLPPRVLV